MLVGRLYVVDRPLTSHHAHGGSVLVDVAHDRLFRRRLQSYPDYDHPPHQLARQRPVQVTIVDVFAGIRKFIPRTHVDFELNPNTFFLPLAVVGVLHIACFLSAFSRRFPDGDFRRLVGSFGVPETGGSPKTVPKWCPSFFLRAINRLNAT